MTRKEFMTKIYFLMLCIFFIQAPTSARAENSPAPFFRQIQKQITKFFFNTEEAEYSRITGCAGLELSAAEQEVFLQSYTVLKDKQDWLTMVDPQHKLPQDYQPQDLVTHREPGWPKEVRLRREALEQMNAMIDAAEQDGVTLIPLSSYRTWNYQKMLSDRNPGNPYVARPGESQHHLGTAVDFNTLNPKEENIPALVWLKKHAGEYGFSLSFPKGAAAEQESGYPYEPWHYRYITREAVQLQDKFFGGDQHKTLQFLNDCQPFQTAE